MAGVCSQDTLKYFLSCYQLADLFFQVFSLASSCSWLRCNVSNLIIGELIDHNRREDLLKTTNNMTFNNLCSDIGNEGLQRNLRKKWLDARTDKTRPLIEILRYPKQTEHNSLNKLFYTPNLSHLVYGKQAIKGFLATEIFHIWVGFLGEAGDDVVHINRGTHMIRPAFGEDFV